MIDAGEVFADVALEDVATGPGEAGEAAEGTMGAIANAVGVGVVDEDTLEDGGDDGAEGVVDDSIAVGCGGNHAGFGGLDLEGGVGTGAVGLGVELVLEFDELGFEVVVEGEDVGAKAFAALGFVGGVEEIGEINYAGPEVAGSFHR